MRPLEPPSSQERAVSELVGFSLMFSIIVLAAGFVTIGGLSQLDTLNNNEEIRSAETGMVATAATLEDVNRYGDLNRSFSLGIKTGSVWINSTGITLIDSGGPTDYDINSLEHRFSRSPEDISIRYEAGGVFRSNANTDSYNPVFVCRDTNGDGNADRATVRITQLQPASGSNIDVGAGYRDSITLDQFSVPSEAPVSSFDRALNFDANLVDTQREIQSGDITVDVSDTSNPEQWGRYFEQKSLWEEVPSTNNQYECSSSETLIRVITIELELENL